jgi:hypothetical protein
MLWVRTSRKDLPLLLFVVAENEKVPEWLEMHHRQAAIVTNGTVVPSPASTTSTTRTRWTSRMGLGIGKDSSDRTDALAAGDKAYDGVAGATSGERSEWAMVQATI